MASIPSLDDLGILHGTDKSSASHNYLNAYEHFLAPFKDKTIDVVEIGIFNGGSARMWLDYFANATIHCIDIDPSRANSIIHPRFKGYTIDHGDIRKITRVIAGINPTILIDDGSHFWEHQIITLLNLAPLVRDKGVVIVEDLEVNYPPLEATYSRGTHQKPVDLILEMSKSVASGGLDERAYTNPIAGIAHKLYSSITCIKHSLIACRSAYYASL